MIASFRNAGTEAIVDGEDSRKARHLCPQELWRVAQRRLSYIEAAATLRDLESAPGNRLEARKGDRVGQHSIRIDDQYRICFTWTEHGAADVEIVDYH